MKNVVFWDIKTQFLLHKSRITSPLQSTEDCCYVRFEVFTAVTVKNVVFWHIKPQFVLHMRHITPPLQSPAGCCYVRFGAISGGDYEECLLLGSGVMCVLQEPMFRKNIPSVGQLLTLSSLGFFCLEDADDTSSQRSVRTRPARRHIPEDCILHVNCFPKGTTCSKTSLNGTEIR
jgi:hypothetical protein